MVRLLPLHWFEGKIYEISYWKMGYDFSLELSYVKLLEHTCED